MTARTVTERVAALRKRRAELGQTRLDVYAHPEDHPAIKAVVAKLNRKRAKPPPTSTR